MRLVLNTFIDVLHQLSTFTFLFTINPQLDLLKDKGLVTLSRLEDHSLEWFDQMRCQYRIDKITVHQNISIRYLIWII